MRLRSQQVDGPLVSVMMPTLNRKQDLLATLARLDEQPYRNIEVVVVDNHSVDGTAEAVRTHFPQVKLIRLSRNFGAIAARNIGLCNCRGEYVLSLDDDSFPGRNCIVRMVEEFEADHRLGIISFGVLDYWKFWHEDWQTINDEHPPRTDARPTAKVDWIGCGGAIRRMLIDAVGGFEEWGLEAMFERSMAARILHLGYKVMSYPDIYVYHRWSDTGEPAGFRLADEAMFTGCRSIALFYYKYFPTRHLLAHLWRLVFAVSVATFVQRRFMYIRALFSSLWMAPAVFAERYVLKPAVLRQLRIPFNFKGK